MKENVFDVLMYLFENYYMDDETEMTPDRESIQLELADAGFPTPEINKAFDWLESLATSNGTQLPAPQASHSIRLFSDRETGYLDLECRGFLLFLEQMGILTPANRELAIDRIMALDSEDFDLEQLKWVVLMVLFKQPGQEAAYAWMEDLVFDNTSNSLH